MLSGLQIYQTDFYVKYPEHDINGRSQFLDEGTSSLYNLYNDTKFDLQTAAFKLQFLLHYNMFTKHKIIFKVEVDFGVNFVYVGRTDFKNTFDY